MNTMTELRRDPAKLEAALKIAAHTILGGGSYMDAARASGIAFDTLRSWQKKPDSKPGRTWRATLDLEAKGRGVKRDGTPVSEAPKQEVSTDGFKSPEQFADHWSLEATRVQVELLMDPDAGRRDRLDAAKHIQALGGHSPVSKSIVVSAPLDNPQIADAFLAVLEEVKKLKESPPPKLIEAKVE